jgi:hypothetical protein
VEKTPTRAHAWAITHQWLKFRPLNTQAYSSHTPREAAARTATKNPKKGKRADPDAIYPRNTTIKGTPQEDKVANHAQET